MNILIAWQGSLDGRSAHRTAFCIKTQTTWRALCREWDLYQQPVYNRTRPELQARLLRVCVLVFGYPCCGLLCSWGTRVIFFPMAQQPLVGQGLLIIEALRSHTNTPHSVGPLSTSDQPDAETCTWQHTTFTPTGFAPAIPASERHHIHAVDPTATAKDEWVIR
jgi:hypothetical protein